MRKWILVETLFFISLTQTEVPQGDTPILFYIFTQIYMHLHKYMDTHLHLSISVIIICALKALSSCTGNPAAALDFCSLQPAVH